MKFLRGRTEPAAQMPASKGEDVSRVYVEPEAGRNAVSAKIKRIGSHRSLLRADPVFFRFKGFAPAEGKFVSICVNSWLIPLFLCASVAKIIRDNPRNPWSKKISSKNP